MEREKGVAAHDGGGGQGMVGERQEHELLLGAKLRRGITIGKRGGICTPVPSWKLGAGPSGGGGDNPTCPGVRPAAVSARKLGANLWEVQDLLPVPEASRRGGRTKQHKEGKGFELMDLGSQSPHHHHRPCSAGNLKGQVAATSIQRHRISHRNARGLQPASPGCYSSSMEIAAYNEAMTPASSLNLVERLRNPGYNLKTSTELLKVLNRIWSLEEQNASTVSLVKKLKLELANASARVHELLGEQQADRQEIDNLLKQVAEDKLIRKNKERERIRAAVQLVKDELEDERRLRRHSESLHRSLAKELCELKSLYPKALKDLEGERKENALLEDLCDELAKGIGDYEQEVRRLKQKNEKDFSPICDRLVLHVSEAWLDERMQLKLAESRGDFSERDSIIERLRSEVEAFLLAKGSKRPSSNIGVMVHGVGREDNYLHRQSLESFYINGAVSAPHDVEDDDSIASDLHCFELNMRAGGVDASASDVRKLEEPQISSLVRRKSGYLGGTDCHSSSFMLKELEEEQEVIRPWINGNNFADSEGIHVYWEPRGMAKFEPLASEIQEAGGNRVDISSKWDSMHHFHHGHVCSTKNQVDMKIHPNDDEENTTADVVRSKGKSIAVSSCDLSDEGPNQRLSTSAVHQNLPNSSSETEIVGSASRLSRGVRENTLKAKLLEARLEGQQARLRTSKGLHLGG